MGLARSVRRGRYNNYYRGCDPSTFTTTTVAGAHQTTFSEPYPTDFSGTHHGKSYAEAIYCEPNNEVPHSISHHSRADTAAYASAYSVADDQAYNKESDSGTDDRNAQADTERELIFLI